MKSDYKKAFFHLRGVLRSYHAKAVAAAAGDAGAQNELRALFHDGLAGANRYLAHEDRADA